MRKPKQIWSSSEPFGQQFLVSYTYSDDIFDTSSTWWNVSLHTRCCFRHHSVWQVFCCVRAFRNNTKKVNYGAPEFFVMSNGDPHEEKKMIICNFPIKNYCHFIFFKTFLWVLTKIWVFPCRSINTRKILVPVLPALPEREPSTQHGLNQNKRNNSVRTTLPESLN